MRTSSVCQETLSSIEANAEYVALRDGLDLIEEEEQEYQSMARLSNDIDAIERNCWNVLPRVIQFVRTCARMCVCCCTTVVQTVVSRRSLSPPSNGNQTADNASNAWRLGASLSKLQNAVRQPDGKEKSVHQTHQHADQSWIEAIDGQSAFLHSQLRQGRRACCMTTARSCAVKQ